MNNLLTGLHERTEKVKLGGGLKKIESHKSKGKLTARERIDYLRDKDSTVLEIGAFAGDGMYTDEGGCPGGGVVTVFAFVAGRLCILVSNDATVKAGAWFPITA